MELKFEQKSGTSLVELVLSRRKSGLLQSVCPSQLYIFDIATESAGTSLALSIIYHWDRQTSSPRTDVDADFLAIKLV
jgi:hypothetical protein